MLLRVVTGQAEKLFDLEVLKKSKLSEDLNSKLLGYSNKLGPTKTSTVQSVCT